MQTQTDDPCAWRCAAVCLNRDLPKMCRITCRPMELVAWWPMNGSVDDAIGSLDGFNQGGVETEGPDGQIGQALELPSGDDYVDLPTGGVSEEGGLTLAFWAWLELPAEGAAPLIDRIEVSNNLWSFSYEQSSETVHFITRNNDGSGYHNLSTWSPPAAEWVHVTSVYRAPSGLKELHVNGSLVGAGAGSSGGIHHANDAIGRGC